MVVGKLRLNRKQSKITDSKATWNGEKRLEFKYCPPKMGLDLTDLPDLRNELIKANLKFAAGYVDLLAKAPGINKLISGKGLTAIDVGKQTIDVAKAGYSYFDYTEKVLATETLGDQELAALCKDTTALLNDLVGVADSFGGGKMNPAVEIGKWVLTNLNVIEQAHGKNFKIATSYDEIIFLPMRVEVTDPEGHTAVIMRKVGVKFPKAQ